MGLSATLSEIFMEDFDAELARLPEIFYASRYVDDIIIFSFCKIPDYKNYFLKILPQGLHLNERKCSEYTIKETSTKRSEIEFLGYSFIIHHKLKNQCRQVIIMMPNS